MMESKPHDDAMAELYRGDPAFALDVIKGILEDGDYAELSIVLRQMAQALGGVPAVIKALRSGITTDEAEYNEMRLMGRK